MEMKNRGTGRAHFDPFQTAKMAAVGLQPLPIDHDLREYLAEERPVFAGRRWTIGGIVSMTPAPPPRRQSLHQVGTPSSPWRKRRHSLGGTCARAKRGTEMQTDMENADPQLRFVTMRRTSPAPAKGLGVHVNLLHASYLEVYP